jgi:transcriptional regulator with XRE-family HTH domain
MNIGVRIKQRRKQLKINADELAEFVGVSPSTIFRYEKGDIEKMPTTVLEKIAVKLNTTPAYLMGWDEEKKDQQDNVAAHLDGDYTEEELAKIREYAELVRQARNKG